MRKGTLAKDGSQVLSSRSHCERRDLGITIRADLIASENIKAPRKAPTCTVLPKERKIREQEAIREEEEKEREGKRKEKVPRPMSSPRMPPPFSAM